MFDPQKIEEIIREKIEISHLDIIDLTGTRDHYSLVVVSPDFNGLFPLKQHRLINEALALQLASGEIHALQLKTLTPTEWEKTK